jgi:hypothetical protein
VEDQPVAHTFSACRLSCQVGNRTRIGGNWVRTGLPQAVTSATYNAANQLTNWAGTTLTYDANGNLTSDGANSYTWNARNQLASMTGASFVYDGLGRRASKTIGGSTTNYLYDGQNPVQEGSANLLTGLGVDQYFTRSHERNRVRSCNHTVAVIK